MLSVGLFVYRLRIQAETPLFGSLEEADSGVCYSGILQITGARDGAFFAVLPGANSPFFRLITNGLILCQLQLAYLKHNHQHFATIVAADPTDCKEQYAFRL